MDKIAEGQPKWVFSSKADPSKSNEIPYEGEPKFDSKTGFHNTWMGYGKHVLSYVAETGGDTKTLTEATSKLVGSLLPRRKGRIQNFSKVRTLNENMDPSYWEAYYRNKQYLALFSNYQVTFRFQSMHRPFKVLDLVRFDEEETGDHSVSAEYHSGLYVISKVVRAIAQRNLVTVVQVTRESMGDQQGSFQ
jgi:hypothetical protein